MEFINILNLDTATEDQLTAAIDCNNRTSRLMRSEIDKLKKVATQAKNTEKPAIIEMFQEVPEETKKSVIDEEFEDEVEYYNSQVQELTLDNIEDEITSALPSRNHYQYDRILRRLKLEACRSIKEIKDLLNEEGFSIEDMEEFKEEIALEKKKIELIEKHIKPEEKEELEAKTENKLIFAPTTGGNIRVLDEIDSIPTEYYDRFYGLFESIKDGTFKNVKRFQKNKELDGLSEVKDFKVRVTFKRVSKDTYAVISAFVKKSDNDKAYRGSLIKKYFDYQQVETALKNNLNNPEFMELHKTYEEELFNKLSSASKESLVVKTKAGDKK